MGHMFNEMIHFQILHSTLDIVSHPHLLATLNILITCYWTVVLAVKKSRTKERKNGKDFKRSIFTFQSQQKQHVSLSKENRTVGSWASELLFLPYAPSSPPNSHWGLKKKKKGEKEKEGMGEVRVREKENTLFEKPTY